MKTTQPIILRCQRGIILGGVLWTVSCPLTAQEALQNAVLNDRAYEARQAPADRPRDERMRLGPVNLAVGISYGLRWDDNIYLTPANPDSDFIHEPSLNVRAVWPATKDSVLSFGMGVGYRKYMDNSNLDGVTITPDSELAWDIPIEDWLITLHDRINYSQDVINEGGLSRTAQFPRLENTIGVSAQWLPAQYLFEVGYDHYNFISDSSGFDYLSRSSEQFHARLAYRFAQITRIGLEASGSLSDYDEPTQGDNQSLSFGPYVDWQLLRDLRLTLRGGFVTYFLEPGLGATNTISDLESYYFGVSAMHQLTDFVSHSLSVDRSVQQGINQGSGASEHLNFSYNASWAFHRKASLSLGPYYERAREAQFGVVEDYDRYGASVGIGYRPTDHFSLGLSYRYTNKDSDFTVQDRDYEQNSVSFSANYQF